MASLAEELPAAQKYARELLATYHSIGPAGTFGAALIEDALQRADQAAASGDVIAMLRSVTELRDLE
jgi:hypothetical protein